jgi:hypothetical protein
MRTDPPPPGEGKKDRHFILVITGLDPVIHLLSRMLLEDDGCAEALP